MKACGIAAALLATQTEAFSVPNFAKLSAKLRKQGFIKGVLRGTQANRDQTDSKCMTDFDAVIDGIQVVKDELGNPNYAKVAMNIVSVGGQGASVFNDCHLDSAMMSFSKMTTQLSGLLDGGINTIVNVFYESDIST